MQQPRSQSRRNLQLAAVIWFGLALWAWLGVTPATAASVPEGLVSAGSPEIEVSRPGTRPGA